MARRPVLIPLVLLSMLVAGCAEAGPTTTSAPPPPTASVDKATGGIEGQVLTDELQPIAGADVGVFGGASVKTGADGAFAFSGLEPGDHTLAASRIGYEQTTQKASVKAGEVTTVKLILKNIPIGEASFNETFKFADKLTLSNACEPQREGEQPLEQLRGISWQEYPVQINATKPDGTDLLATRLQVELKSTENAATVDIDVYLYNEKGTRFALSNGGGPNENVDHQKILEPGKIRVHVCFWVGATAEYKVSATVTYEQGERAKYFRANPKEIPYE